MDMGTGIHSVGAERRKEVTMEMEDDKKAVKVWKVTFRGWDIVQVHRPAIVLASNAGECLKKALRHKEFPQKEWVVTGIELVADSFI